MSQRINTDASVFEPELVMKYRAASSTNETTSDIFYVLTHKFFNFGKSKKLYNYCSLSFFLRVYDKA